MASNWDSTRPGETEVTLPEAQDAWLRFIGRIETPFETRDDCPRQGDFDGPECRVILDASWAPALQGIERRDRLEIYYWLHQARRDLLTQTPRGQQPRGTFDLRSPVRPNPIGMSVVKLLRCEGNVLVVRGLDCLNGTPLIDIKPRQCHQDG
jgi:tRNA-Thr(GGU) m(6)t(6)A37 methyltransferase TsaA